jgi:hypothetical protein
MTTPSNRSKLHAVASRPERSRSDNKVPTNSTLNIEITRKFSRYDNEYRLPLERDTTPPPCKIAFLCVFSVAVQPHPYVQYLLYKYDGNDGMLAFPIVARNHTGGEELLAHADSMYTKCCGLEASEAPALGYIHHGDNVYIFYEYPRIIPLQTLPSSHRLWWALLDEICNHKKLLTFPVDSTVYRLFYENQALCRVLNSKDEIVPAPKTAYYGADASTLAYAAAMGIQQSDPTAPFGPFYYFNTFNRAVRFSIWDYARSSTQLGTGKQDIDRPGGPQERHTTGGVVRHAVFTGGPFETYIPLGHKGEANDQSDAGKGRRTHPRVKDMSSADKEKLARLTDHNAAWVTSWSSVFSGAVRGEDGGDLKWTGVPKEKQSHDPTIIVRDFSQQTALSVHYVDTEGIKHEWRNDNDYTIS